MKFKVSCVRILGAISILSFVIINFATLTAHAYEEQINKLSGIMAEKINRTGKTKIAAVDFTNLEGEVTALGRFISEEFSVALASAGKGFKVVDRTHLNSLLKEHKLATTGLIDPQTAKKLGQIAGVDALITGTITPFGDSIRLSVKILDTETAEVIDAQSTNIPKTQAIEELLGVGITSGDSTQASSTTTTTKAQKTIESKGFNFALQQCKKSGDSVTCEILVTSIDMDRQFRLHGNYSDEYRTRIFDNLGNEYTTKLVQLGNKQNNNYIDNLLVTNVPTKAILHFQGLSPQASGITLFEISCWNFVDEAGTKIHFRNVSFNK